MNSCIFRLLALVGIAALHAVPIDAQSHEVPTSEQMLLQYGFRSDLPSLAKALQNKNLLVIRSALNVISERGHRQLASEVTLLLNSPENEVRVSAAATLLDLGELRMRDFLHSELEASDPFVRLQAARALCRHGDIAGRGIIESSIRSTNEGLRTFAVETAGRCQKTVGGLALLLYVLKQDQSADIRLQALLEISTPSQSALAALLDSLDDPTPYVRFGANETLCRLTHRNVAFPHEGSLDSRRLAILSWKAWLQANRARLLNRGEK